MGAMNSYRTEKLKMLCQNTHGFQTIVEAIQNANECFDNSRTLLKVMYNKCNYWKYLKYRNDSLFDIC